MNLNWLVLLIAFGGCLGKSIKKPEEFDLPTVVDATKLSSCAQNCLTDLFTKAAELTTLENPVENFKHLCSIYNNASICVAEREKCYGGVIFDITFVGLDELCYERQDELEPHVECLERDVENELHRCDESCHFRDSLEMVSKKESVSKMPKDVDDHQRMLEEVAPVCTSTGCMTACIADRLNKQCGEPSGSIIVESLLRPLSNTAQVLGALGPHAQESVRETLPEQCRYVVDNEKLDKIIEGILPEGVTTVTESVPATINPETHKLKHPEPKLVKFGMTKGVKGEAKGVMIIVEGTAKVSKGDGTNEDEHHVSRRSTRPSAPQPKLKLPVPPPPPPPSTIRPPPPPLPKNLLPPPPPTTTRPPPPPPPPPKPSPLPHPQSAAPTHPTPQTKLGQGPKDKVKEAHQGVAKYSKRSKRSSSNSREEYRRKLVAQLPSSRRTHSSENESREREGRLRQVIPRKTRAAPPPNDHKVLNHRPHPPPPPPPNPWWTPPVPPPKPIIPPFPKPVIPPPPPPPPQPIHPVLPPTPPPPPPPPHHDPRHRWYRRF